jgi:hypothetical protein
MDMPGIMADAVGHLWGDHVAEAVLRETKILVALLSQ